MVGNGNNWQEVKQVELVSHGTLLGFYLMSPEKTLDSFKQEFVPPWFIFFKDHSSSYLKEDSRLREQERKELRKTIEDAFAILSYMKENSNR